MGDYVEIWAPKLGRRARAFSVLEYDHLVLMESDPWIVSYCEQPLKASVYLDGHTIATIFDAWVLFADGEEELRETKYATQIAASKGRTARQLEAQRKWCAAVKMQYRLMTDLDIRRAPLLLENWKRILPHLIHIRETSDSLKCLNSIHETLRHGAMTLDSIERAFDGQCADPRALIFSALHRGLVQAPSLTETRLSGTTLFSNSQ